MFGLIKFVYIARNYRVGGGGGVRKLTGGKRQKEQFQCLPFPTIKYLTFQGLIEQPVLSHPCDKYIN